MTLTKSELREMIREVLKEELKEGAFNGGYAEGGSIDTAKRPGGNVKGSGTNFKALDGKKTKKVLAKDIKPGMVTDTGKVLSVKDAGYVNGKPSVEIGYGTIGARGSYASDCVAKDREYEVLDEALEEDLLEGIFEGIFDSKETKQKKYNQIIANAFDKKAPASIAADIAGKAVSAVEETNNSLGDDNEATTKAAAKNFISALTSAKAGAQKSPFGMLNSIIAYVQKYDRDSVELADLVEFKRAALKAQTSDKDGKKAMEYLLGMINKQLTTRVDNTIAFLKKEYGI